MTNGKRLMAYSSGWNYAPERTNVFGVGVRMLLGSSRLLTACVELVIELNGRYGVIVSVGHERVG